MMFTVVEGSNILSFKLVHLKLKFRAVKFTALSI